MSRKVLMIVSLMLVFSWPLTAGKVTKQVKIPGANAHVVVEQRGSSGSLFSIPENQESDAILSAGERRRAYITGGLLDTVAHCPSSGAAFVYSAGEYELVMYELPTSGIVKGVNLPVAYWGGTSGDKQEVTIWKVTYPEDSEGEWYPTANVDTKGWAGYWWDEVNNKVPLFVTDDGVVSYYGDTSGETGPYAGTAPVPNAQDLIKERVWPASDFVHATFTPTTCPDGEDCWLATADYGAEPEFEKGDWVGILVQNQGPEGSDPIGYYYCDATNLVDQWVFAKFYNEAGGTSGEGGWHIRHWALDWPMAIEWTGDLPPSIDVVGAPPGAILNTDAQTIQAEITDTNPAGGEAGLTRTELHYRIWTPSDGMGEWVVVDMTDTGDDIYEGVIPGMDEGGSEARFVIWAEDVGGLRSRTVVDTYRLFLPVENNLFSYNSNLFASWIKDYYLYNVPAAFRTDFWSAEWGETPKALLDNYDAVVEITGGGPLECNMDAPDWLAAGGKTYILAGDEWLGACFSGWEDGCDDGDTPEDTYSTGDLPFDVFGITGYHSDVSCWDAGGDGVTRLMAVEDDLVSGDLYAFLGDSLDLNYDPNYEIGADNWFDMVDVTDDVEVSFWGYSATVDDTGGLADTSFMAVAGAYKAGGSGTAFFSFDPLSTNTSSKGDTINHKNGYYWIGIYPFGPLQSAIVSIIPVSVEDEVAGLPSKFDLRQNYPNPFNPVTTINFDLPSDGLVTLTVYNLLGQKVATLVNEQRRAGTHTVTWNGRNDLGAAVSTGVYLYRIDAGDFSATKKMIMLK